MLIKKLQNEPLVYHEAPVYRSSPPGAFPGKAVLKIYSKFTGEHPC